MTAQLASPAVDAQPLPRTAVRWWHEALILGSVMVALLLLGLWQLGGLSLWRDEVASVVFAKGSLGDLLTIIGRDRDAVGLANMATYYLLLHFWLAVGETESRIRLLSVLFGVASVVPVYFIARRLGGWLAAGLAAAIFALIPYVIHYSQEARGYSLAMLIGGALTWLVLIGVERGRGAWWPWLAYGLIAALGLYVHFFVALVVAAHGLWLLVTRQVPGWRGIAAGGIPLLLAAAPIPLIIVQFGGEQEWIPPLSLSQAAGAITDLAGGLPLLLALTALGVVAVVARPRDPLIWLVVGCIVIPIVGAAAISVVKPMFVGRYLIIVLPFVAVLAACALVALPKAWMRGAAAVAVAGLLLLALPSAYADTHQQDWRAAGPWMASRVQAGDRLIAGNGQRSINYYLRKAGTEEVPRITTAGDALAEPSAGRVWLVMTQSAASSSLRERLAAGFDEIEEHDFGDHLTVVLLEPRDASAPPG